MRYASGYEPELWKGAVAGLAAGLAGTVAMTQFQNAWAKISEQRTANGNQERKKENREQQQEQGEPATAIASRKLARGLFHRELSGTEKEKASYAVHYAFGTLMGGAYGVAAEFVPQARAGFGLPFATALFLGGDELAVPALGLSRPAKEYPLSAHIYGLLSHLVYGASTEAVRRGVRAVLR